jgi:adenylate kinase
MSIKDLEDKILAKAKSSARLKMADLHKSLPSVSNEVRVRAVKDAKDDKDLCFMLSKAWEFKKAFAMLYYAAFVEEEVDIIRNQLLSAAEQVQDILENLEQ